MSERFSSCHDEAYLFWGGSKGEIGAIASPIIYESNFIHHDFLQFGKQHSRYKVILSSIVLSQQFC